MSSADQAMQKASGFQKSGASQCSCPDNFASRASSQIKSAGKAEAMRFSHGEYGHSGEQTNIDRKRAAEISDASQHAYFDGLDQIKKSSQQGAERQAYHSAALDEIYKSIGISPRGEN